jgi:uncharacterized protein (DUF736 family)
MRKRILTSQSVVDRQSGQDWLDLEQISTVEVSSEDPAFPIESALRSDNGSGWRAAEPGKQYIRLIFDQPVSLRRIHLRFDEHERERTQEFTLAWRAAEGGPLKEIVRQQWNFSPNGSIAEIEDYSVKLEEMSVLELTIQPDLTRGDAVACLTTWRVA